MSRRVVCMTPGCTASATSWDTHAQVVACQKHAVDTGYTVALTVRDLYLWRHTLDPVPGVPRAYRLTSPDGGEMESIRIVELPGPYVAIYGDLCPSVVPHVRNGGVISEVTKDLEWFARASAPHYLGEKFLSRVFRGDLAVDYAQRRLEELRAELDGEEGGDDETAHRAERWAELLDEAAGIEDEPGKWAWWQAAHGLDPDFDSDELYGYDADALGLLGAIQRRFSALWFRDHTAHLLT